MKNLTIIITVLMAFAALAQNSIPAPSLLRFEKSKADSGIILKWNAPAAKILGFVIERREGAGPWLIVGQAEPGENSFLVENSQLSKSSYRVRSYGDMTLSEYSNVMDYKH